MEGRKLRRQKLESPKKKETKVKKENNNSTENVKKEKRTSKGLNILSKIIGVLLTVAMLAVLGTVIYLKVLPNKYLIPICIVAILLDAVGLFFLFRKKTGNILKIILSSVSVVLIAAFAFVGLKLVKTINFLGDMTTETVNAKTYSVVVLKDSEYAELEDVAYKLVLYYDNELGNNTAAIEKLKASITIVAEKTDDIHELATKLIDGDVDAVLIEDSHYAIIEEEIEDFREKTNAIYTFSLEDTIETIAKNVSVTKEPFNVYISGIDSYGKISSVARSDVNMVISVNPQTKQVLLVNIPRDYYVKLHGTSGYRDKLTHAGIYGIDMSVKTVEDLFDIDINYYVRVNFTSLIKIIDAIGGINVYSKYEFTSRIGNYHFEKGYNQMNGKQALGFARERYSFSDGDRMRGQNQQAVIDAMIKKVCSSSTILTKFDSLLDSLKGSFQTNMDYTKMIELVRMQISDNAEWNISSISVDGSGSTERTYSMGKRLLYVMIPYAGSINQAETLIKSVLNGETLEAGNIDISKYNDRLVVARGNYPDEEDEKESEEETSTEGETTTTPETPSEGGTTTTPETPSEGGTTTTPDNPSEGGTTTTPETPSEGGTTTTPETPSEGGTTTTPETPSEGGTTTTPDNPSEGGTTTTPETPSEPETPTEPETPVESGSSEE